MLKTVFSKSISSSFRVLPTSYRVIATPLRISNNFQNLRFYSHAPELTKDLIKERVYELLESFAKVADHSKITPEASFTKDLGLDSLDVVEVVMNIEEEFSIEIPDHEADEIKTVGQAINYIASQPDAC